MTETYILNIIGLGKLEIVETYVYYDQPVLFKFQTDKSLTIVVKDRGYRINPVR